MIGRTGRQSALTRTRDKRAPAAPTPAGGTFRKLMDRRAFSCAHCRHHVYPTAGTVFQDTRTPLRVWFYAVYLVVTTRHGVSGKELQRALGVTYKTARRTGQHIRLLMAKADGSRKMQGHVEIDEAYVGGHRPHGGPGKGKNKTIVLGIVERNGRTAVESVPSPRMESVRPFICENIKTGSAVSTGLERQRRGYGILWKLATLGAPSCDWVGTVVGLGRQSFPAVGSLKPKCLVFVACFNLRQSTAPFGL
jgi:ISXO2-like transposase domain